MSRISEMQRDPNGVTKPDPDPTARTTEALLREVGNLRESMQAQLNGLEKGLLARIEGIEKAIEVAHGDAVRIPTLLQEAIGNLRALTWERFDTVAERLNGMEKLSTERLGGINSRFDERDTRVEQTAKAGAEALSAALQAAKEAVGAQQQSNSTAISKSEQTTKEQINALNTTIQANTKASDEKIDDLKDRLTRLEGQSTGRSDTWGWVFGAFGVLAGFAGIIYTLGHVSH
jgi:hypothetical protein